MSRPVLITFPPSLDSELARFLLAHHGVAHDESRHTLVFSSFATLWRGRTVRFPLLYADAGDGAGPLSLHTPAAIAEHLEATCPPDRRLRPVGVSAQVLAQDWQLFHSTLSTATTVFAYYHLLPHRETMVGPLSDGAPRLEVAAVQRGYPAFALLLRTLLRLTPSREQGAVRTIDAVLDTVDARLADGRRYLYGDDFTLPDLDFAVAAAPVVWPPEYGGAVPPLEDTPPALRQMVERVRARPSGAFALRLYREHRAGRATAVPVQPSA